MRNIKIKLQYQRVLELIFPTSTGVWRLDGFHNIGQRLVLLR